MTLAIVAVIVSAVSLALSVRAALLVTALYEQLKRHAAKNTPA